MARQASSSSSMPAPAAPDFRREANGAVSISTRFHTLSKTTIAGALGPTTAYRAKVAWRASTSQWLLLRELAFELAVAVERDLGVAFLDLADDVHHAAAADRGRRLDGAVLAERRFELALGPALLLEQAFHRVAVDRDGDRHLVGHALRAVGNVYAVACPGVDDRFGLRRTGEQQAGHHPGKNNNPGHRNSLPSEMIPDRLEHRLGLLLPNRMPGLGDPNELRFRNRLFEGITIKRRDQHVLAAPHDQRLCRDTVQALRQTTVGDGEKQLAGHAQPPRVHDQELLQELGVFHVAARGQKLLAGL